MLLPLVSGWMLAIYWLSYVFGIIGLVCAIVAMVKNQKQAIVGLVLNIASIIAPIALAETYAKNAVESAANMMSLFV